MTNDSKPPMTGHTSRFDPVFHWWNSHSFRYVQGEFNSPTLFAILLGCLLATSNLPIANAANAAKRSIHKVDSVQACWNNFKPAQWGELETCLSDGLVKLEAALANALVVENKKAAESRDAPTAMQTLRDSNVQWLKFRDIECVRRQAIVAGRNHTDIGNISCQIRMIQGRLQDFKFDD